MTEKGIDDRRHAAVRRSLRTIGPIVLGFGAVLALVGLVDFFRSFGGFEPPRYFWCAFVGLPIAMFGVVLTNIAYLGAITRYVTREGLPIQREAFNEMVETTSPAIEALARAVGQGISAGTDATRTSTRDCPGCHAANPLEARFCQQCGIALSAAACPRCAEPTAPGARFCSQCGSPLG